MVLTEEEGNIPYSDLGRDLFQSTSQQWIPFLGAGVSISASTRTEDAHGRPNDIRIENALQCLRTGGTTHFSDESLFFIQSAMELALDLEQSRSPNGQAVNSDIYQRLKQQMFPPSTGELTEIFRAGVPPFESVADSVVKRLGYSDHMSEVRERTLRLLRSLAEFVSVSSPSLAGMTAYFELLNSRTSLLKKIAEIFGNKANYTPSHKMIARAAARHLRSNTSNFLIITTNYDCLMEKALEDQEDRPPYVILSAPKSNFQVRARFGNMGEEARTRFAEANPPRGPNYYDLKLPDPADQQEASPIQRLVVIYKMHGCIHDLLECPRIQDEVQAEETSANCLHDGIVLSDDDYITSIARLAHNDGFIPVAVATLMRRRPMLFLGYSLGDWNVRGFLKVLREKGAGHPTRPDYAVVRRLNTLERGFFDKNNVVVLKTELNIFASKLGQLATGMGVA